MKTRPTAGFRRERFLLRALFAAAVLILPGAPGSFAQMIDLNGNGMSDVWEWLYNATGLAPSADADRRRLFELAGGHRRHQSV